MTSHPEPRRRPQDDPGRLEQIQQRFDNRAASRTTASDFRTHATSDIAYLLTRMRAPLDRDRGRQDRAGPSRGVEWVRPYELLMRAASLAAGYSIDRVENFNRRSQTWVTNRLARAARLAPPSAFGAIDRPSPVPDLTNNGATTTGGEPHHM